MTYPNTQLFINGQWQDAADGRTLPVFNPASGKEIGRVAHAGKADLDRALEAAQKGFETWRDMTPAARSTWAIASGASAATTVRSRRPRSHVSWRLASCRVAAMPRSRTLSGG